MRKLFKNKRALSTVISTVLMIMVVMIGMSILFAYIVVFTDNFHSGSGSAVLEQITVEDVNFKSSSNVVLSIFNTGKTEFQITSVYINGAMATLNPSSLSVKEGEHGVLSVAPPSGISFNSADGYSYNFKIVTARGTALEGTYVW
jgi:hypothetical protein